MDEADDTQDKRHPKILTLTGGSGAGKTTFCSRIVNCARTRGLTVAGLITRPRYNSKGEKTALDVEDIRTGEIRTLAERLGTTDGPQTIGWHFHAESLDWGTEILRQATPIDLLLIDELGPLELVRGLGWTIALQVLSSGGYRLALVVVRPALVPFFQKKLHNHRCRILRLTESNRHALDREISARLKVES